MMSGDISILSCGGQLQNPLVGLFVTVKPNSYHATVNKKEIIDT